MGDPSAGLERPVDLHNNYGTDPSETLAAASRRMTSGGRRPRRADLSTIRHLKVPAPQSSSSDTAPERR